MSRRERPYLYYDAAASICSRCLVKVEGKIVFQDGGVYMLKRCPEHGPERVLIADDVEYYRRSREQFIKTPEMPQRYATPVRWGCPYDCGLCVDHEQHSCLVLVEITDRCNLTCPVCYSDSSPARTTSKTLAEIEALLDATVRAEGKPDVVQISGGEPTVHPDFFRVLDLAKARPIGHLMVNTNGLRIAQEEGFAKRLAEYAPGFEVYLQFDSLRKAPLEALRGADLRSIRMRALERLNELNLSTTLVVTVKRGLNDDELGEIVEFATRQRCVRGVTFQPVQAAGRLRGFDPATDRLTLTEVRRRILEQTSLFRSEDVLPVPCHPDGIAMAYALKLDGKFVPLTGLVDPAILIEGGRNTIVFERDEGVRDRLFRLLSTNHTQDSGVQSLRDLLCCLPHADAPADLGYGNLFRVIIMQFLDAHSFDVRAVRKTCVHVAQPDGRMIPLDTYNLFYRDRLAEDVLAPLRRRAAGDGAAALDPR